MLISWAAMFSLNDACVTFVQAPPTLRMHDGGNTIGSGADRILEGHVFIEEGVRISLVDKVFVSTTIA